VSFPSADTPHDQALGTEDSRATGSASNRGNSIGHVLLEKTESDKGVNLLDTQTHTPPQSKHAGYHHLFYATVVGPWGEEEE